MIVLLGLTALLPADMERRAVAGGRPPRASLAQRLAKGRPRWPRACARRSTTCATRAWALAYAAAIGFWAGNIMTLWAAFKAFGVEVPLGVLIQGFFVGMAANLAPSPAAGVGTVDAGPDRAFVVFGLDAEAVFRRSSCSRLIGFWLPIPLGVVSYLRLLRWRIGGRRSGRRLILYKVK